MAKIICKTALMACLFTLNTIVGAQTPEYLTIETTAAESIAELETSLTQLTTPERPQRAGIWRLPDTGPFLSDSQTSFKFRGYDFERTDGFGTTLSQAFALGGELRFESGEWKDNLSVAASWYTSQGIDAPENLDGTGLLGPGQSDISVIGRAFVKVDAGSWAARFYRQDFMLPYINRQDIRMIPITHEAYGAAWVGEKLNFVGGHVTKIKLRTSEEFIPMAEAAGVEGGTAGTTLAGLRYTSAGFEVGGLTAYTHNAFNIAYGEVNWAHTFSDDWAVRLSAQYTDQRSVGRQDLGDFSTHTWGVRFGGSFRNGTFALAYTDTDEAAAIRGPFGGRPTFNSMMVLDFDQAGEEARRISLSYHFGRIGLPALSVQTSFGRGRNAIDAITGLPLSDAEETDITIDYRPQQGKLEGLWIRLRMADVSRMDPANDRTDVRLIINYDFAML